MEVRIKFSKEEAESFKNFMNAVKPDELPEEAFMKQIFFYGCNAINTEMTQMMAQKQAELQAEGKMEPLPSAGGEAPLLTGSEVNTDLSQESTSRTDEVED